MNEQYDVHNVHYEHSWMRPLFICLFISLALIFSISLFMLNIDYQAFKAEQANNPIPVELRRTSFPDRHLVLMNLTLVALCLYKASMIFLSEIHVPASKANNKSMPNRNTILTRLVTIALCILLGVLVILRITYPDLLSPTWWLFYIGLTLLFIVIQANSRFETYNDPKDKKNPTN